MTHEMDSKNAVEGDRVWKIAKDEILGIKVSVDKNSRNYLRLTTVTGDWDVYPHFYNNLDAINDAITCLINGSFLEITPARYTVRDPFTLTQSQLQINRGQVGNNIQYDQEKASQGLAYSDARILFEAILERGVYSVIGDLRAAMGVYPDKKWIPTIVRAISAIAHLLNRCETQAELSTTFCNHYYDVPELRHLCKFLNVDSAFITPLRKLPDKIDDRVFLTLNIEDIDLMEGDHPIFCQFSKDGNYFYVFTKHEKVLVYDRYSGILIRSEKIREYNSCRGEFGFIPTNHKRFYADDDVLYAITAQSSGKYECDLILKIWSIPEFQFQHSITIPKYDLTRSSFGSGGILAYIHGHDIVVVDLKNDFNLLSSYTIQLAKEESILGISFGPESKWIAIGIRNFDEPEGTIKILDYNNGEIIKSFGEFDGNNWNFAISPSGRYIATPYFNGERISLWNILTEDRISVPALSSIGNSSVKFSSDEQNAIILSDGNLFVFSLKSREIVEEFKGFKIDFFDVDQFHNHLAAVSEDGEIRILAFGETSRLKSVRETTYPDRILPIPHRSEILTLKHNRIGLSLLDTETLDNSQSNLAVKVYAKYETRVFDEVSRLSVSPSGQYLLINSDVWSTDEAKVIFIIPSLPQSVSLHRRTCLLNDQYLIDMGNNKKPLLVYDFTAGVVARELVWPSVSERGVFETFGLATDSSLIIGFFDGSVLGKSDIVAWNFHNGEVAWRYSEVNAPLWSKPAEWDPEKVVTDYKMGIYYSDINSMNISPDQQKIAVGFRSGYLAILNPTNGKVIRYWHAHPSYRSKSTGMGITKIFCDFDNDSKLLISTCEISKELKVWDVETGEKVCAFYPDDMLKQVRFLENREIVAVGKKGLYWLNVTKD